MHMFDRTQIFFETLIGWCSHDGARIMEGVNFIAAIGWLYIVLFQSQIFNREPYGSFANLPLYFWQAIFSFALLTLLAGFVLPTSLRHGLRFIATALLCSVWTIVALHFFLLPCLRQQGLYMALLALDLF